MRIKQFFISFIAGIFVVYCLLYIPLWEKEVYININKGIYLKKIYLLKINISSEYSKNQKIENLLEDVGLLKEYDDYLFLYGYKSFIFRPTQRLTGPYQFEYFLENPAVQNKNMGNLLKAIQDRNYTCYQKITGQILKNNM